MCLPQPASDPLCSASHSQNVSQKDLAEMYGVREPVAVSQKLERAVILIGWWIA